MGAKASTPHKKKFVSLKDTGIANAFDATSPCYSFQSVLQAQSAYIFLNPTNTTNPLQNLNIPLLFSDGVPFSMASLYIMEQQMEQQPVPVSSNTNQQGPVLTEDAAFPNPPDLIPFGQTSPAAAQYSFVNQNDKILIQVSQGDGTGYLTFSQNPECGKAYTSQVVLPSKVPNNAGFGVIWAPTSIGQAGGLLLTYSDDNIPSPMLVGIMGTDTSGNLLTTQLFSGYNQVKATAIATNVWHGLFDPSSITMSYNTSTMQLAASSPAFDLPRDQSVVTYSSAYYPPFINMAMFQCVAAEMDVKAAKFYMSNNCMGTSTSCLPGSSLCTPFSSCGNTSSYCLSAVNSDLRGQTCQWVALVDKDATDAAYQAVCGIDPNTNNPQNWPPDPSVTDALKTLDCACVNYKQSTYMLPNFKNRNFQEFSNFLSDNGLPLFDSGDPMCWWPPCTFKRIEGQAFPLHLSTEKMNSITGVCPDTTMCINEVTVALKNNSKVTVNALNDCYQGPSPADGPGSGPPPPATNQSSFDKLLHSKTLQITAGILGVVLLLFIIYVIMNPKLPPTVPQQNYRYRQQ